MTSVSLKLKMPSPVINSYDTLKIVFLTLDTLLPSRYFLPQNQKRTHYHTQTHPPEKVFSLFMICIKKSVTKMTH